MSSQHYSGERREQESVALDGAGFAVRRYAGSRIDRLWRFASGSPAEIGVESI